MTQNHPQRTAGDAPGRPSALRRVVAAHAVDGFGAETWSRRPLLSRAADLPADFSDLFDPEAVDELVSRRGLRTPFLRMAKDGSVVPSGRYTGPGGTGAEIADQVVDDRVLALVGDGSTLVLQALHRTWPPLVEFAAHFSSELGHPVQVNAYITPPQNQGFSAHYDTHDVVVLQVAGRKQWRIHRPVLDDPMPDQPWDQRRAAVAARAQEPPELDEVLQPGDALYLPRGYIHAATALGETSIHLTIGVHPITRQDVVRHLLAGASGSVELRASLPMGADLGDPDVLAPHLRATVQALHEYLDRADAAGVARLLSGELARATRPEPLAPLAQLRTVDALATTTAVRARVGLRWRIDTDADGVHLRLRDRTVSFPAVAGAAIKTLLAGATVTPAELPGLDAAEQLVVVRRLLREGVLLPG